MSKYATRLCLPLLAATLVLAVTGFAQGQGIKYLPSDTEVVISLNLQQVWDSKLAKDYGALLKQIEGMFNTKIDSNQVAAEIKKSLGIDPLKDISSVTIGMSDLTKNPKNALVVLEGKFNQEKFTETADKAAKDNPEAVKSITIGNATVYQITKPGDDSFFIGLLNKNSLVIAKSKDAMTAAVNAQGQNLKKETADLLQSASLKKSLSFVVTSGALQESIKQGNNPQAQMLVPFLKDLKGLVVTANVVSDIDLHVEYVTNGPAAAQKMADATNQGVAGLKALLGNQAQNNPDAAAVLDILGTLKVSAQGNTMTINGSVSRKVVDQAVKKIENFLP